MVEINTDRFEANTRIVLDGYEATETASLIWQPDGHYPHTAKSRPSPHNALSSD